MSTEVFHVKFSKHETVFRRMGRFIGEDKQSQMVAKEKLIEWLKSNDVSIIAEEAVDLPPAGRSYVFTVMSANPAHELEGAPFPVVVEKPVLTDEERKRIEEGWEADPEPEEPPNN